KLVSDNKRSSTNTQKNAASSAPTWLKTVSMWGRKIGWKQEAKGESITVRLTKRGLTLVD
ncbi:MAG TPA: hypothetical protein DHW77_08905, partial [Verrucomicrobiales bacterium]|nr:hypothetical protein [Verrucomicrobiales bacterium]